MANVRFNFDPQVLATDIEAQIQADIERRATAHNRYLRKSAKRAANRDRRNSEGRRNYTEPDFDLAAELADYELSL